MPGRPAPQWKDPLRSMPATIRGMDYGLGLPNMLAGASAEGIEAAAEVAERLGYTTLWTTDHVLVNKASADEYGRIFDAILTLAHVAGRTTKVRLGTSVIVVPQRQAVTLVPSRTFVVRPATCARARIASKIRPYSSADALLTST